MHTYFLKILQNLIANRYDLQHSIIAKYRNLKIETSAQKGTILERKFYTLAKDFKCTEYSRIKRLTV